MKNILCFKAMALSMVTASMLLASSCNKDPRQVVSGPIHVTVKVSYSDAAPDSKAIYDNVTKMLSFETGDKLFVSGSNPQTGIYAGVLDYTSGNTFDGDIWPQYPGVFTGTSEELFNNSTPTATLLPKGYTDYGYLSINGVQDGQELIIADTKAIVSASTSSVAKKLAVEQFSLEQASGYDPHDGFVLHPQNIVLSYAIGGMNANTVLDMNVTSATTAVDATTCVTTFTDKTVIAGDVTTDASGYAYFAVGITPVAKTTYTFFVGSEAKVSLSNRTLSAGKIYNISRPTLTSSDAIGTIGMFDGREAIVVELSGTKYAIATMNEGARTVEDFGSYASHGASVPGAWHVPSASELEDAFCYSSYSGTLTTQNEVHGYLLTIDTDHTIFLPSAGRGYHGVPYNQGSWGCYLSSTDPFEAETNFLHFDTASPILDKFVWSDDHSFSVRPFCVLP